MPKPKPNVNGWCIVPYTANGDVTKDWYVSVYRIGQSAGKRHRLKGDINKVDSAKLRKVEIYAYCKTLERLLAQGWTPDGSGDPLLQVQATTLLDAFDRVLTMKSRVLRPDTIRAYRMGAAMLGQWLKAMGSKNLAPGAFGVKHGQMFWNWIQQRNMTPTSMNTYLRQVSALFKLLVEMDVIHANPMQGIKKLRAEVRQNLAYSKDEQQTMVALMKDKDPDMLLFVQFIYYCAIRPAELVQLRIRDVQLNDRQIYLAAHTTKNRQGAHVLIPAPFLQVLQAFPWDRYPSDWFIFGETMKPGVKHILRDGVTKRHARLLKEAGLAGQLHTLYAWKHTGIVAMAKAGAHMRELMVQCRHTDINTTATYLRSLGIVEKPETLNKMAPLV